MTQQDLMEVGFVVATWLLYCLWPVITDGSYKAYHERIEREEGKCQDKR